MEEERGAVPVAPERWYSVQVVSAQFERVGALPYGNGALLVVQFVVQYPLAQRGQVLRESWSEDDDYYYMFSRPLMRWIRDLCGTGPMPVEAIVNRRGNVRSYGLLGQPIVWREEVRNGAA